MQAGFLAVGLHGLPYHTITNSEGKTLRAYYIKPDTVNYGLAPISRISQT